MPVRILNVLFPPKCFFCRTSLPLGSDPSMPCPDCIRGLPVLPPDRQVKNVSGVMCAAPLAYRGTVPGALKAMKFNNRLSGVRFIAAMMRMSLASLDTYCPSGFDVITWVPLSLPRLHKRGYNQSELLARELASMLRLPCRPMLLRTRHAGPQSKLGHDDHARLQNVCGSYAAMPFASPEGKRVLLVDDIATSGATLASCAGVLSASGAARVAAVAAAHARPEQ